MQPGSEDRQETGDAQRKQGQYNNLQRPETVPDALYRQTHPGEGDAKLDGVAVSLFCQSPVLRQSRPFSQGGRLCAASISSYVGRRRAIPHSLPLTITSGVRGRPLYSELITAL